MENKLNKTSEESYTVQIYNKQNETKYIRHNIQLIYWQFKKKT